MYRRKMSTQTLTADELLEMADDGFLYELVEGELRRMSPAGSEHGAIGMNLVTALGPHVKANDLGVVFGPDTGFRIASAPDTVRSPDVSFVRRERVPRDGLPEGYWPGAPDLAVEIISPSDTYTDVEKKVTEWLDAGACMVVVITPRTRTVTVHSSSEVCSAHSSQADVLRLRDSDVLDLGDAVPGFSCTIADIMA